MWKKTLQVIIPLFCVWHMAAISLYLVPDEIPHPIWHFLGGAPKNFVRPYIYALSQWQKWDIFSPNPQRYVASFSIDEYTDNVWLPVVSLTPYNMPWWMRVKELKILGRINDDWKGVAPTYLQAWCREIGLPTGTTVRLSTKSYSIPLPSEVQKTGGWAQWSPAYSTTVIATTTCSSPLAYAQ